MLQLLGLHDAGGESLFGDQQGFVVVTEEIGSDPNDYSGRDYRHLAPHRVIVRLNNGLERMGLLGYNTGVQPQKVTGPVLSALPGMASERISFRCNFSLAFPLILNKKFPTAIVTAAAGNSRRLPNRRLRSPAWLKASLRDTFAVIAEKANGNLRQVIQKCARSAKKPSSFLNSICANQDQEPVNIFLAADLAQLWLSCKAAPKIQIIARKIVYECASDTYKIARPLLLVIKSIMSDEQKSGANLPAKQESKIPCAHKRIQLSKEQLSAVFYHLRGQWYARCAKKHSPLIGITLMAMMSNIS